jgi:DNA-binding HxlR family transcriptional regulator
MAIPRPGTKVRGSESGAPINALFDLMGRRWALGIVWNLGGGPRAFRELQELCGTISPSILNNRLKDLREAAIVVRTLEGYELTPRGAELRAHLVPLADWSAEWSEEIFGYKKPASRTTKR